MSELEEVKRSQKKEYYNFVLKLYEHHQRLLSEQQQCNTIDFNGKEIVSEVINEMKKEGKENSNNKLSKELLKLDSQYINGNKSVGNRSRAGSISSLSEIICPPSLMSPSPMSPSNNSDEKLTGEIVSAQEDESIGKIKEMGFTDEQAKVALEMTNRNLVYIYNL
jgi:hypothetical protein